MSGRYLVVTPWSCGCEDSPGAHVAVFVTDDERGAEAAEELAQRYVAALHTDATLGTSAAIPLEAGWLEEWSDGGDVTEADVIAQEKEAGEGDAP